MQTTTHLPDGYEAVETIDLQKDRKLAVIVNGIGFAVIIILCVMPTLFGKRGWYPKSLVQSGILALGLILYLVLHEFTHGITMKMRGGKQVKYGFTGLYAYAGSDVDYYDKKSYIMIALAPVIVWGFVFTVLLILVPSWFGVFYLWQIGNISGACGDLFVTFKTLRRPDTILVKDTGVSMTYYDKPQPVSL